jgi:hypothetical protein
LRLIDDFLSHSGIGRCTDFRETAEIVAKVKLNISRSEIRCTRFQHLLQFVSLPPSLDDHIIQVGLKVFLGVAGQVGNFDVKKNEFSLILDDNPLVEFVELPEQYDKLWYSNVICGVLRGSLEMVRKRNERRDRAKARHPFHLSLSLSISGNINRFN